LSSARDRAEIPEAPPEAGLWNWSESPVRRFQTPGSGGGRAQSWFRGPPGRTGPVLGGRRGVFC
jgi:hypothetical protein